jgi:ribose transport system permease protein
VKKLLGIIVFLLILYGALLFADPGARSAGNHYNLGERIGLTGILTLGAGLLIITGGLDLSLGSAVGLCATTLAVLLVDEHWPPLLAMGAVLILGASIGLFNGLLVTRVGLQPFVVTLCGLFMFRSAARWVAGDKPKGLGTQFVEWKQLLAGSFLGLPIPLLILMFLVGIAILFVHFSVYGRYFYALGSNERAARYSGIPTDRYRLMAYVLCSTLGAFFSILLLMKYNTATPSTTGEFYELYAIAGAVLGGCSLRGGEGSVPGILIGTSILVILPNLATMWGVPNTLNNFVIGGALLLGAILDEVLRSKSDMQPTGQM